MDKLVLHSNVAIYRRLLSRANPKVVIATGPAGTGKTMIPALIAQEQCKKYDKMVIARPLVTVGNESVGYLPGDLDTKLTPWLSHMHSLPKMKVEKVTLGMIRGHTWDNAFVLADEMQNATKEQMKTVLTRVGSDTKLVITGDLSQKDIRETSGLEDILEKLYRSGPNDEMWGHVHFELDDVERSEFVKFVLSLY